MKKKLGALCAASLLIAPAFAANPVTVASSGGDFTSVQAAIDSFCSGGANAGETPPFTINIDPAGGPYDESLTLDATESGNANRNGNIAGDIVIQSSTPGTKVVLLLQDDPAIGAGTNDDGLEVVQNDHDVTFRDLVFAPSLSSTWTDDLVKTDESAANTTNNVISFYDCVFTDIDATGTPIVTSKADLLALDFPTHTYTSGSSMVVGSVGLKHWNDPGEMFSLVVEDCVFYAATTHNIRAYCAGQAGETIDIVDSLFANTGDWLAAINIGGLTGTTVNITGTQDPGDGDLTQVVGILSSGWHPFWISSDAGQTVNISNVLVDSNDAFGTGNQRLMSGGSATMNVDNVIGALSGNVQFGLLDNGLGANTYDNMTMHIPGASTWLYLTATTAGAGSITLTDCILSGAGVGPVAGGTGWLPPTGGINLNYCGIVKNGPHAVAAGVGTGTGVVTSNIIEDDPLYVETADSSSADFFDVSAPSYGTANSLGGGLAGGADYVGTNVRDWMNY